MNFSTRAITPGDWRNMNHFTERDFLNPAFMGFEFVRWLDLLRTVCGFPFRITSSYRTPEHNKAVGGAPDSAHCDIPCNAVDIGETPRPEDPNWNHSRYLIVNHALAMECSRIGLYADGSIHLDKTQYQRPSERIWRIVGNV